MMNSPVRLNRRCRTELDKHCHANNKRKGDEQLRHPVTTEESKTILHREQCHSS